MARWPPGTCGREACTGGTGGVASKRAAGLAHYHRPFTRSQLHVPPRRYCWCARAHRNRQSGATLGSASTRRVDTPRSREQRTLWASLWHPTPTRADVEHQQLPACAGCWLERRRQRRRQRRVHARQRRRRQHPHCRPRQLWYCHQTRPHCCHEIRFRHQHAWSTWQVSVLQIYRTGDFSVERRCDQHTFV